MRLKMPRSKPPKQSNRELGPEKPLRLLSAGADVEARLPIPQNPYFSENWISLGVPTTEVI